MAIGGKAVLEGSRGEVKGSAPGQDSVLGLTGGESLGAAADGVVGGGCDERLRAWGGGPGDGLAVVSRARGVDDAKSSKVSKAAGVTMVKDKRRCSQQWRRSGQGIRRVKLEMVAVRGCGMRFA